MPRISAISTTPPLVVAALAIGLHLAVWVTLPTLLEGSIRLDVAEHVLHGREWLLAYPKQPPFSMWLVALVSELGPARYPALYLLGQLLALSGLIAASFVLRKRGSAALATTILIGLPTPFLTYVPIQVNHNVGVMPFWGLALAGAYAAFEHGRRRDWLLFGAAAGLGVWAKFSIFHLVAPLALAFFAVPYWRRQAATAGPWLAGVVAAAIAAPHVIAVAQAPGSLAYATRALSTGPLDNVLLSVTFLALGGIAFALMGLVSAIAVGFAPLWRVVAASFTGMRQDRLALFLHAATFGPVVLIAFAALAFGIRPRPLWLTPIALSGVVWWGCMVLRAGTGVPGRLLRVTLTAGAMFAAAYIAGRSLPWMDRPSYPDFDGPALARLAEQHWRSRVGGPIPYIVSFIGQRGRQAAGSIVFDSADHPKVFENADLRAAPWIDVADLARRGALVVSTVPISADRRVADQPIEDIVETERPTIRAHVRAPARIYFGIVRPAGR
jgi:4-amino-4-deoxy-L-arabinose transferase-like glycosyltransferase